MAFVELLTHLQLHHITNI